MNNSYKRLFAALLSVVLVLSATVINALAYITDESKSVVNTFIFTSPDDPTPPDEPDKPTPPDDPDDPVPPPATEDEKPPVPPPATDDEVEPENVDFDITVSKTVDNLGSEILSPEGFEFALKDLGNSKTYTKTTDKNGLAVFSFTFTADDIGETYKFALSEVAGNTEGVIYSTQMYEITLKVTLSEDNKIIVTAYNGSEEIASDFTFDFTNIYEPPTPVAPGDTHNYMFYILMALISLSGVGLLIYTRKKVI